MALLSRVFGYLDLIPQVPAPTNPIRLNPASCVVKSNFDGISFAYPDADRLALDGFDLTPGPGGSTGLVGVTGSGRSTAAATLSRLARPTSGRITIDGVDL